MRIYFDREHAEQLCDETGIGNKSVRNLNSAFNKNFIFPEVEVGIPLEDELQNLVVVCSRIVFFDDFVVDFKCFVVFRRNLMVLIHLNLFYFVQQVFQNTVIFDQMSRKGVNDRVERQVFTSKEVKNTVKAAKRRGV